MLALLAAVAIAGMGLQGASWYRHKIAGLQPVAGMSGPPTSAGERDATDPAPAALLLFGDSRVAQWAPLPARSYPISRQGFPGATAIQLAPHLPAIIRQTRPRLIIIEAGINDAVAASLVPRQRRRQALAETIAAFRDMAAAGTESGARVVFLSVLPPVRPGPLRSLVYQRKVLDYVAAVNVALNDLARADDVRVVDVHELLAGSDGTVAEAYRKDALHLTPMAYLKLGQLLPQMLQAPDVGSP